jgi:CRISPR-associated Csx11 family protein
MSEFESAKKLQEHRPLLLAMEAIGWLHMTGKLNIKFLQKHGKQDVEYEQCSYLCEIQNSLNQIHRWLILQYPNNIYFPQDSHEYFKKFTKQGAKDLVGLLQAAHGITSGIEKNIPLKPSKYLSQDITNMWLTSPYGYFVRNMLNDIPPILSDYGLSGFLDKINQLFFDFKSMATSSSAPNHWHFWRENAIGQEGFIRKAFLSTLAETRLPNNDVTLWDQSYVAASLFKSSVAGAILPTVKDNSFNLNELKSQTRWRLLTVGIGADHYEERAVRVGDWTGFSREKEEFFHEVKKLIEVDLAIGNLLYFDTDVHVYSFPGVRYDHDNDEINDHYKQLIGWITNEINQYAIKNSFETPTLCKISKRSSRSLIGMTKEIKEVKEKLRTPFHEEWIVSQSIIPGKDTNKVHICPVCQVRFNQPRYYSDETKPNYRKENPCQVCGDRRTHRQKHWLNGELGTDSIWISELADDNNRVALITMNFDLDPWMDGTHIDSLRAQAAEDWRKHNPSLAKEISENNAYSDLLNYVQKIITQNLNSQDSKMNKSDLVMNALHDGYKHETKWEVFYNKIVEDRADAPKWVDLDNKERAHWFVHQLLRKHASPGRVHRFWRNTEEFFQGLLGQFRQYASEDANRWRVRRLSITATEPKAWKDREPYNGHLNGQPISLLYRGELGDFITIGNVSHLLVEHKAPKELNGKELKITGDDIIPHSSTVKNAKEENSHLSIYHPIIPLEVSPARFRVLVPLKTAEKCVQFAVDKWKTEFTRVWDRMPLRVGVVAFSRMMPFQAVIEATRNVEDQFTQQPTETWCVRDAENRDGVVSLNFIRDDNESEICSVPIRLPDGRLDAFYPYCRVKDSAVRDPNDFQHPRGQVYRHMQDLRRGDGVEICPSKIAIVFMESTARRFEPIHAHYLSDWKQIRELWQLLRRIAPSQTALRGAWGYLIEQRDKWQTPDGKWSENGESAWLNLVRSVFADRLDKDESILATLVDTARTGVLDACLQWHLTILKEKVGENRS